MKLSRLVVALAAVSVLLAGCSSDPATSASSSTSGSTSATTSASTSSTPATDWYATTYGTFTKITKTGNGASVITLPKNATYGIITASYTGSGNFIVQGIDATNQPTVDGPVNAIGAYSGVTAFGLDSGGTGGTVSFQVTATGPWKITIAPIDTAKTIPASGKGDGVFKYDGAAKNWTITHNGAANFIVNQYSDQPMPGLGINEIGKYSGTVPGYAGPSVVTVQADGVWTVK